MFEKEIKFISDFSLNKIKKLGSFFTFEKLFNSDIHPAILQYINSELDYLIYQDRNKLLQKSVFDYTGAEISKYFNLIGNEIKKNKKVSYEDIKKLLIQAVSFNINFTVRPKWSLIKLVYEGSEVKPVEEIKMILNYLYYYDYIKNIFGQYLSKKKIYSLSQVEFEVILNKIDKAVLTSQPDDIIDNVLFSIGEFHNIGSINKTKISVSTFELYLKEKNLIDQLLKLRKSFPADSKQKYDIDDIQAVLYSSSSIDFQPEATEEEIPEDVYEEEMENETVKDKEQSIEHETKFVPELTPEPEIVNDVETELKDETILEKESNLEPYNELELNHEPELDSDLEKENIDSVENEEAVEIKEESSDDEIEENDEGEAAKEEELQEEEKSNTEKVNEEEQKEEEELILDTEDDFKIDDDDLIIDEEIEKEINKGLQEFNLEESAEDILSKFDEELKSFEEEKSVEEMKVESDEDEVKFDISEKEKLDTLYDFEEEDNSESNQEEETENLTDGENLTEEEFPEDEHDNSLEANSEIEEPKELENDDFDELEEANKKVEEKERTDLYGQVEEFENEEQKIDIDENDSNDSEDTEEKRITIKIKTCSVF